MRLSVLVVAFATVAQLRGVGVAETPQDEVAAVAKANALSGEGKKPFHVKVSFQLFDLSGSHPESGSAEEWWAGNDRRLLRVNAPSLGTLDNPTLAAIADPLKRRDVLLIRAVMDFITNPAATVATDARYVRLVEADREIHRVKLNCVRSVPLQKAMAFAGQSTMCWEGGNQAVRLIDSEAGPSVTRNKIGVFAGTLVSVETEVDYEGRQAIAAHIDALNTLDPSNFPPELQGPVAPGAANGAASTGMEVPGAVLAGQILEKPQPEYPMLARQNRLQGTVLLTVRINDQGKVDLLTPIASPNEVLTEAAQEAVRRWRYKPYLLNGVPTEVDATVTVNFRY